MLSIADSTVAEVISEHSLNEKLKSGRKLIIKFGVDPTSPDLHLGHAIALHKLRQFQDLGHRTILLIGDFTTKIGDPSGRNSTRPVLSDEQIKSNMETYIKQARLIIDPKKTRIQFNSEWLAKKSYADFIQVAMQVNVQTLLEREDFAARLKQSQPLGFHELFYPVTQGLDSVEMKADVEIGGWDQRLNLLMGRELQKKFGQTPQDIVVIKGLVGLDGQKKMSKSYGNYVGLTESADSMFGKLMSIPDHLIQSYAELAALMTSDEIKQLPKHPRDRKAAVAEKVVALYHGQKAAEVAKIAFDQTFKDGKVADQLVTDLFFSDSKIQLLEAVTAAAQVSRSQAQRLIEQKAVRLDGQVADQINLEISLTTDHHRLQVGKHTWCDLRRRT